MAAGASHVPDVQDGHPEALRVRSESERRWRGARAPPTRGRRRSAIMISCVAFCLQLTGSQESILHLDAEEAVALDGGAEHDHDGAGGGGGPARRNAGGGGISPLPQIRAGIDDNQVIDMQTRPELDPREFNLQRNLRWHYITDKVNKKLLTINYVISLNNKKNYLHGIIH